MRGPRLKVGVLADEHDEIDLGLLLSAVGHDVSWLHSADEAGDYQLVVISVIEDDLPDLVAELAAEARRGQMYLHTSLGYGVQILDPLEFTGALVLAAHPLSDKLWAVGSADELGETVVELLVGELGGQALSIPETQRARLAAAMSYVGFLETIRNDAFTLLSEALGNEEKALSITGELCQGRLQPGVAAVEREMAAIHDPGRSRTYRDLTRRTAELSGMQDIELWAIQEEKR
ncbi:6PGD fold domain-containing protein [Corynebacterium sp. A21]|uniref:6PGD fold domain-containing protein n=1 Tax=Corynebacterium sp. A21 TaxID=3457318 RepID=UPI003FD32B98